jgi:hypothetical protein
LNDFGKTRKVRTFPGLRAGFSGRHCDAVSLEPPVRKDCPASRIIKMKNQVISWRVQDAAPPDRKVLYLCGGMQSSGTTLVSWCFLQRADMDGVLDGANDLLPSLDPALGRPLAWYKTPLACFRLCELVDHYSDQGWEVHPLLVVRDLRKIWASLLTKSYGVNGITAEDPPLGMRVRRFIHDWEQFRSNDWPILRYESLVESPRKTLLEACTRLGLPWDEGMIAWPKRPAEIAEIGWGGNDTFWKTRAANLVETLAAHAQRSRTEKIPAMDLSWLESEFREFNAANGYPLHLEMPATDWAASPPPSFTVTRRYRWETARKPLRRLLLWLGIPNARLIESRTVKKRKGGLRQSQGENAPLPQRALHVDGPLVGHHDVLDDGQAQARAS